MRPRDKSGDRSICLVLALAAPHREGAAIYGRASDPDGATGIRVRILSDVAGLAHAMPTERKVHRPATVTAHAAVASARYPEWSLSAARCRKSLVVERIKDSESTVLITGESGRERNSSHARFIV